MQYQFWAGDEKVGDPLPGDEAASVFRDQWEMEDLDNETGLAILPVGYRPECEYGAHGG